jgi:hypothetical protein
MQSYLHSPVGGCMHPATCRAGSQDSAGGGGVVCSIAPAMLPEAEAKQVVPIVLIGTFVVADCVTVKFQHMHVSARKKQRQCWMRQVAPEPSAASSCRCSWLLPVCMCVWGGRPRSSGVVGSVGVSEYLGRGPLKLLQAAI